MVGCLGSALAGTILVAGGFISLFQGCGGAVVGLALDVSGVGEGAMDRSFDGAERTFIVSVVLAVAVLVFVVWYLWPKRPKA